MAGLPAPGGRTFPARQRTQSCRFPSTSPPWRLRSAKRKAPGWKKSSAPGFGREQKVGILALRQEADEDLKKVADYVYEHVFVHYTVKQWGTPPEQIDPATTARVPVFLSTDDRYFQDRWQGIPKDGYTALFEKMLDHPNITVLTGTPCRKTAYLWRQHSI